MRSQAEEEMFRGSSRMIGSDLFRKQHVVQDGHAMLRRRGRPKKGK